MNNLANTVYVIDDDDEMRHSLSRALTRLKYQVEPFHSAKAFVEQVSTPASPSVILLDMQMPDMSGLELQEHLSKSQCPTPIIFISGQSHPQQIIDGLHSGAYRFLLKPFNLEEVLRYIDEALQMDLSRSNLKATYLTLTPREKEVFNALAMGRMVKQIALDKGLSMSVVKLHKSNVMKKLGLKTLSELVRFHKDAGLEWPDGFDY